MTKPLWTPTEDRIEAANTTLFIRALAAQYEISLEDSTDLYRFSINEPEKFWRAIWQAAALPGNMGDNMGDETCQNENILQNAHDMEKARFFPNARLNFAEAALRRRDNGTAIFFKCEDKPMRSLSYAELYRQVAAIAQALLDLNIKQGDRVAAYAPNTPETLIAFLATAAIGAVWTSCSPDFGAAGVIDRFGQCQPKILFAADGYIYNGKEFSRQREIAELTQNIPSIEKTIMFPYVRACKSDGNKLCFSDLIKKYKTDRDITFTRIPFNAPQFIMYSSGTTGKPKCIVHSAGGPLIKLISEHQLQCDIKGDDRVFFFTTCGWMMWNWLIAALASQASVVLYDGSPLYPNADILWDYADEIEITHFGTSAKYMDALANSGAKPKLTHKLKELRCLMTTGSPLLPEQFDYIYTHIKNDLHLASISGGTDILGLFVGGDPTKPVYKGEIQAPSFGMAVEIFNEQGQAIKSGRGELVCTKPFPSQPIGFWNDPHNEKYHNAYYGKFPNNWHHGDFLEMTPNHGYIIYGRSDATLNPGGVRIGTAEIYAQTENLPEIDEAIAVGQNWQNDTRIVLFVRLKKGYELNDILEKTIRDSIKRNCSPRHVPAKIIAVPDIPRTRSGKITEIAVRDIINGKNINNIEAIANPEALKFFQNLKQLKS